VPTEEALCATDNMHPGGHSHVAGTEPEGLLDVSLGLLGAAGYRFGPADGRVSVGQVWIDRQRPLTLGDGLLAALVTLRMPPRHS
jgi:hypothetical protein